jgi:hypothetical protein
VAPDEASAMATVRWRAGALAPAGVGLALFVVTVQSRMNESWAEGVLLLAAAIPAALLLYEGLTAEREDQADRAAATLLLVAGLALAGIAIARLGQVLAGDDLGGDSGGTLTWMLALFTLIAAYCHRRSRSVACLLIGALAAVGLLLAAVHWIFQTDDLDVYRGLLAFSFLLLFGAGVGGEGRSGTVLVGAAGVTVLATAYLDGFFLVFGLGGDGIGWGWELVTIIQGAALALYAVQQVEPGPGYLAFFVLVLFALSAAQGGSTLVGWPLALAILTALAGTRAAARA